MGGGGYVLGQRWLEVLFFFFWGRGWEGRREVSSLDFQGELMKIYERSGVKAEKKQWLAWYLSS